MWLAACSLAALSLATAAADRLGLLSSVRPVLLDTVSPGRLLLTLQSGGAESLSAAERTQSQDDSRAVETARLEQQQMLRRLMIENAVLRRELQRDRRRFGLDDPEEVRSALLQLSLLPAQVLSCRDGLPADLRELLVDAGRARGLTRSELVVQGHGGIVGAGRAQSVQPGDRVLDGLAVVGRIEKSARWVSLVQPISASGFRANVLLLRKTDAGAVFGARGILEGVGEPSCRLNGIAATEAVAVGDEVVAADVEGLQGPQLYFGKVVQADFLAGGQWDIRVAPAVSLEELREVQILHWELQPAEPSVTVTENRRP
jgi:cell shape-determining protein MreC